MFCCLKVERAACNSGAHSWKCLSVSLCGELHRRHGCPGLPNRLFVHQQYNRVRNTAIGMLGLHVFVIVWKLALMLCSNC